MEQNTDVTQAGDNSTPKKEEIGVNSTPKKEEKTFTQEEMNQIITGRIAKEKEKYSDYEALKTQASELQEIKQKYSELENNFTLGNNTLTEVYDSLVAELDEDKKNLIPEQLSITDKIKYINKNKKVFNTVVNINTPAPEKTPKGEAGLYGGKYTTLSEFASNDPKGYIAFRKNQTS